MSQTRSAKSAGPDPVRRSPLATDVASMGQRIETLHGEIRRFEPAVERMACALYDPELDLLKTFVNSTLHGEPLSAYEYRLADSPALLQMARSRQHRVIDDIPAHFTGTPSPHTSWLLAQGFKSSCTLPLFVDDELQGFLFFDSTRHAVFTPQVAAQLAVYGRLVALMIREGSSAVRALLKHLKDDGTTIAQALTLGTTRPAKFSGSFSMATTEAGVRPRSLAAASNALGSS